jgi:integrase
MGKLTALKVRNAAPGVHSDGAGLILRVKPSGARSWVLRVQNNGLRRDVGLGSDVDLTLAEAREKAAHLRKLARQGKDPAFERDRAKLVIPTFAQAVTAAHEQLGKGWSDKTAQQFKASLELHAVPVLGRHRVDRIETEHVIAALAPIWTDRPQIARKVRHRILQVLAFAKSHGWRRDAVPGSDDLRRGLGRQPRSQGFAAVPYVEIPALVEDELANPDSPARLALLFTILTAARSGEVRHCRWPQINQDTRTWLRPAEMMKSEVAHTVTLSAAALAVLERAKALSGEGNLVFPSRSGEPLSDTSLAKILRSAGRTETVHGFRSAFRDWAAEMMPQVPSMVAEMALAHSVGNATVEAYLRSDLRELRSKLTDAWGGFVAPSLSPQEGKVVQMVRA